MKYFLHDCNSFDDEKITELYMKFGYEGLGLFYTLLEKLAKQEKPIKTAVLKKQLNVGKKLEKVWLFMEEIEIISSSNGETFNENILNFSEKYQIKKEKTREKVSQWRKKQEDTNNVTGYVPDCNPPKVKESKVNINKVNIPFDVFWDLYDKKIGNKNKVEKKWIKLSDETRQKIIDTLPAFKKQISDKAYQPFAETYLNNERWNDELQTKKRMEKIFR
jgi:hypothetical protein